MNRLKNLTTKYGAFALIPLWGIVCFAFFQGWYHYHFFYQEQNQLFLASSDYLLTYFEEPAWLSCLLGDWLTQFYYYLYAGPAILCLGLILVGCSTYYAIHVSGIKNRWITVAIALAAMTIEAIFSFHYDYRLSSVLSFVGGSLLFGVSTQLIRRINSHFALLSAISIALCVPLTFWLFGYGVWVYAAWVTLGCLLYIRETSNYLHFGILVISMFLLSLCKRLYFMPFDMLYSYPGIGEFQMPQMDLEKTLAAEDEYYFGNYNKLTKMVEEAEDPNPYMKFYYNLAMAERGLLPNKLLSLQNNNLGTFEKIGPDTPTLTTKSINNLYWTLGDMTFAERATMLGNVCSPNNRNIRMIKRLAEINLVSGDKNAARKHLYILQKTFVWKNWAYQLLAALDQQQQNPASKAPGILQPYLEKAQFTNRKDTLRLSDNGYTILQELLESNPENHIALDYLLCSDLLLKDMETFKHDYDTYYLKQQTPHYEKLYQEALMIYLAGTNAPQEEWQKYIKRMDIMQRFQQYNQQRGSSAFADTYWYYFDKGTAPKLEK